MERMQWLLFPLSGHRARASRAAGAAAAAALTGHLPPGSSREVKASAGVSERIVHKLRGKREFTVLATLRQEHLNSGVILSIHHSEQRRQ
ncbi:hypothetical protein CRUP_015294 [Coryphaenoides rupestris]|nr:hypothetical protein CRUP_015294 [Coryphaenoides rupestris]